MTAFGKAIMKPTRIFLTAALGMLALTPLSGVAAQAKQWSTDRPAFYGVWQIEKPATPLRTSEGKEPPLLPAARAAYEKTRALRARDDTSWDPVYQCQMHGVPRLMYEAMPFQILQTPKQLLMLFQWNREFRMIDMNVAHSEPAGPQFQGQSVGKWEGDALVVDSNAFDASTYLDASGLPHSEDLHVVERYQVIDQGRTLLGQFTIEDPKIFSAGWQTSARFRKLPGAKISEDTCVERLKLKQYE
jgi:hypothetical protein